MMPIAAFLQHARNQARITRPILLWVFLLLGLMLGILGASLLVAGQWQLAFGLVFILPATVLLFRYPFLAVIIWLLLDPFLLTVTTSSGRMVYWMVHRALPPITVGILAIGYLIRSRKFPTLGVAEIGMLGYVGATLFSIAFLSKAPKLNTYQFYDQVFSPMCLYFIVRLYVLGEKEGKQLIHVIFFLAVTQATVGILSWLLPQFLPDQWISRVQGQRTTGTLIEYSVYSSTMIFVGLFLIHAAFNRRPGLLRTLLTYGYFLSVFCLFISFSRAAWFAGILVTVGVFYLYPKLILHWIFILIPATILVVAILFVGYFYDPSERLNESQAALTRLPTELAALRMFEIKPIFGWGYGNFEYYDRPFQGRVGDLIDARRDTALHNLYLEILAEQGIVGLVFFLTPVLWWLLMSIKRRNQMLSQGFWNRNLFFLLWLVILDHFIENNFSVMWIGFGFGIWWLTLGLIANMVSKDTVMPRSIEINLPTLRLLQHNKGA